MFKELFEADVSIEDTITKNKRDIEKKIHQIIGERRGDIEDHWKSGDTYKVMYGSKKCYAADSWNSSISQIKKYFEGMFKGHKIRVGRVEDDECEYEWSTSISIEKE